MKIIHITTAHRRYDTRIFHKYTSLLSEVYRHRVLLFVADNRGDEVINNIQIRDFGGQRKNRIMRILLSHYSIFRAVINSSSDIIHFHDPELIPLAILLKITGKTVIFDVHEDYGESMRYRTYIPVFLRRIMGVACHILEKVSYTKFDAVVFATPHIMNKFGNKPHYMCARNYPLAKEFHSVKHNKPDDRVLCYVGGISRVRGILQLLDALGDIPDVRLILAGEFESLDLQLECQRHPNWRLVDFRGFVNRAEVQKIFYESSHGILNFLPGPNHDYALPNKLFEYAAAGLVVVSSNFTEWRSIIEKGELGACIDPSNPKEIAAAVLRTKRLNTLKLRKSRAEFILRNYVWENELLPVHTNYEGLIK